MEEVNLKKRKKKVYFKKTIYFKFSIALVIIISIFSAYFMSINAKTKEWENKIYPGVSVNDVDLSDKTKEEAMQVLQDELLSKIREKKINITVGDIKKSYYYSDIEASYDFEKAVEEALNHGKKLGIMDKKRFINKKNKDNIELNVIYNEDKIQELVDKITTETRVEPIDASVKINAGEITIVKESLGSEVLDGNLVESIKEKINGDIVKSTDISFSVKELNAKITEEDLSKISKNPMSSFETSFGSSNAERSINIDIAASLVNGTLLMPGEEFSYSEVSQKGRGEYKLAGVYINNKVEQAEAGGICQASTTLYRAVMGANIRSTERLNHSLPVGYSELGLDATVAWGNIDYKFKNTYDFPIYIEATTHNKIIKVNIYGDTKALDGKTYGMKSEIIETIEPSTTYVDDPTIPIGTEELETSGKPGYKVKSYLITYKKGVEIDREVISIDTYATQTTIMKRGTSEIVELETPKAPVKTPVVKPVETPTVTPINE